MARVPDSGRNDYYCTDLLYAAIDWLKQHYFLNARQYDDGFMLSFKRGYDPPGNSGVYLFTTLRTPDVFWLRTLTNDNMHEFRYYRDWTGLGILVEKLLDTPGCKRPIERGRSGVAMLRMRDLPPVIRRPPPSVDVVPEEPLDLL